MAHPLQLAPQALSHADLFIVHTSEFTKPDEPHKDASLGGLCGDSRRLNDHRKNWPVFSYFIQLFKSACELDAHLQLTDNKNIGLRTNSLIFKVAHTNTREIWKVQSIGSGELVISSKTLQVFFLRSFKWLPPSTPISHP